MKSVLGNVSTWHDLKHTIDLEKVLRLPYKFYYFNCSENYYKVLIEKLKKLEIEVTDITDINDNTEKVFWESDELSRKYSYLNTSEIFELAYAKVNDMSLLTNNFLLFDAAKQENVVVFEISHILNLMLLKNMFDLKEYNSANKKLRNLLSQKKRNRVIKNHSVVEKLIIEEEEDKLNTRRA